MEIFAWVFLIFCIAVSIFGTFLPALPGTAFILIGALVHKYIFPNILNTWVIVAVAGLALLGWIIDFIGLLIGTKWGRATRHGMLGAMAGGIIGLFFPPIGFIAGPALGAMVAELISSRNPKEAFRSGVGAGAGTALSLFLRIAMNLLAVMAIVIDLFVN